MRTPIYASPRVSTKSGQFHVRGDTPLGFGEVNDEVVVEYDEPDLNQDGPADRSRATP